MGIISKTLIATGIIDSLEHRKYLSASVLEYYDKTGMCLVKVKADELKIGDEVYLFNFEDSVKDAVIKKIKLANKNVESVKKGDDAEIGFGEVVKEGTDVYLKEVKK